MPISSKTSSPAALTGSEATRLSALIKVNSFYPGKSPRGFCSAPFPNYLTDLNKLQVIISTKTTAESAPRQSCCVFPSLFRSVPRLLLSEMSPSDYRWVWCHAEGLSFCFLTEAGRMRTRTSACVCVCVSGSRCGYLASTVCEGKQIWTPNPDSERQHLARI